MRKLTPSEKQVLSRLLYPEPFEIIQEETGLSTGSLRDDLINLINYRLIEVVNSEEFNFPNSSAYDTDNLQDSVFRATKSGLKKMRQTA